MQILGKSGLVMAPPGEWEWTIEQVRGIWLFRPGTQPAVPFSASVAGWFSVNPNLKIVNRFAAYSEQQKANCFSVSLGG